MDESTSGKEAPQTPSPIVAALLRFCDPLAFAISREVEYPRRPEFRKRLGKIRDAAALLLGEMSDTRMNALLYGNETKWTGNGWTTCEVTLGYGCNDLLARVDSALANIPTRPGRDKHYADSSRGPDALEYCALIVATVWRAHAGKWPGNKNPHAFELCEALWTASGGEAHGGLASENGALTAWRRHLTASKKFRPPHAAGELVEQWRKTAAGEAAEPVNPNGTEQP